MTALVSYAGTDGTAVGLLVDGEVHATDATDMLALICAGPDSWTRLEAGARIEEPLLLAPLRPGKLLFCGVNYPAHLEENPSAVLPEIPFLFSKLPSAVVGPGEPIVIPSQGNDVDYEVELAIVIGRRAQKVARADALGHVFGYTVVNDVSARDVQFKDAQITLGKNADSFCPMGPAIVLTDEIPDPQCLRITTTVNGAERQSDETSNMLFDVATLIAFVSATITLEPGDVLTTGTPAGVGCFRDPPAYLSPGDDVVVAVEGVGALRNPVVAGW